MKPTNIIETTNHILRIENNKKQLLIFHKWKKNFFLKD